LSVVLTTNATVIMDTSKTPYHMFGASGY
jgi:hypothetical protein